MSPDDLPPMPAAVDIGEQLTPEEQAQFDAMRNGGDMPPEPPPSPEPEPAPPSAGTNGQTPPPEPPPAPTDDDDIEVAAPVSGTKQKRVSIHKFQRMEERARQFEEQATQAAKERQELMDRLTRTDERLKIINEALVTPQEQQQQQDEDPAPDPQEDIFAYVAWQGRQISKLNEQLQGYTAQADESRADTDLAASYQRDAARFAATEAAFAEAYVYLFNQRDAELKLAGVTDEKKRRQQIVNEEKGLVRGAIAQNRSPAELIFQMALGRGYQKKAAPAAAPAPNGKDPKALDAVVANGGGPAPAAPPAPSPAAPAAAPGSPPASVTAEIEAIKRGQEAAVSLSNVGGGAPVRELTSKVLADMPEEEFNKLVETLPRERLMELMGN